MAACATQTYNNLSRIAFMRVKHATQDRYHLFVTTDTGCATERGWKTKSQVLLSIGLLFVSLTSFAQFTGPSETGRTITVKDAFVAPVNTYVTVTGNVTAHLRENYYKFRDETGEVRVEIQPPVWQNRMIGPDTKVKLVAEVDRNAAGTVYLWVKSLEPAPVDSRPLHPSQERLKAPAVPPSKPGSIPPASGR